MIHVDLINFKFILNFEYVAVLIMSVMLIYLLVQKKYVIRRSRIFIGIILLNIINTAFDILASNFLNIIIQNPELKDEYLLLANIFSNTYFLLLFVSIFDFAVYVIMMTCGFGFIHKRFIRILYFYFPAIIMIGIIIVNFFSNSMIYYDYTNNLVMDINVFTFVLYVILAALYLIQSILLMFKYKAIFEKKQLAAIVMVLPIMFAGMLAEIVEPKLLILSFMISIAIILIQTVLESSEDSIDSKTNLPNIEEFYKSIKKAFLTKDKSCTVVLIRIENYRELVTSYSINEVNKYFLAITKYLTKFRKQRKIIDDLYSLNNGYYASICSKKVFVDVSPEDFYDEALEREYCPDYFPNFELCYFEPYNDFENADEAINFTNNYREMTKFNNNYVKYSDVKDDRDLNIQNHIEQIIDNGLKENEFQVYYQPIYSIKEKKFKTAEALVRLISKKYGFISPAAFIPYAENMGRIGEIDGFVMEEVFKFVSSEKFCELGLEYIEVNLSMAECASYSLVERIKRLKEKYNIDPKRINLEITESFDSTEQREINNNLNKLVDLGFKFALDDYGTGYSNINRFSNLPISIVKIDKSLVDESENPNIKKILNYSFEIVRRLDKETVVEGVETKEQFELFEGFEANYIQGFYFSKPLNFNDYIDFLKTNNK